MSAGPCFHCLNGDGHLCTAVGCYGCACGRRDRKRGVADRQPTPAPSKPSPGLSTITKGWSD